MSEDAFETPRCVCCGTNELGSVLSVCPNPTHTCCQNCWLAFLPDKICHFQAGCPKSDCLEIIDESIVECFGVMLEEFASRKPEYASFHLARQFTIEDHFETNPSEIIDKTLYLGNEANAVNANNLQALGITHVVNMAIQSKKYHEGQFTYMHVRIYDVPEAELPILQCLQFISDAIAGGGRVLVHCLEGRSRSASIVIAYLMHSQKLSYQDALALVRSKRPIAEPNEGFAEQLRRFQQAGASI
eukprot:TRINITY_DN9311_c0_g1_i1.p1 TRINITY_DN9311_c0_g1~~TRINITY_DN9311_c0_g1_i1.p1  ORF type:complete len:244 (-),score=40.61 TRINITY_DN9311_c0_g1_i1:126-857(-)